VEGVGDGVVQDERVDDAQTSFCDGGRGIEMATMGDRMPCGYHEMWGCWPHEPKIS
jgi:hypothetical protein